MLSLTTSSAIGAEGLPGSSGPPTAVGSSGLSPQFNDTSGNTSLALPALSVASFGTWPMYDQNNLRTGSQPWERTLAPDNVSQLTLAKNFPFTANGSITGSASVANGTAYFGTMDGHLYALNVSLGAVVFNSSYSWEANTTGRPMKNCSGWPAGIMSTPAIWGNRVIVGTGDAPGKLGYGWVRAYIATGRSAGNLTWSTNLSRFAGGSWAGAYVWSSPVVWDGHVYIGFSSGGDCPLVQGALFELNATTGQVLHQANMTGPGTVGSSIWSSPSIDPENGTIWVTTGNNQPNTNEPLSSSFVELYLSNLTVKSHWQVPGIAGLDDDFGAGPTLVTGASGAPIALATNKDDITYAIDRGNPAAGSVWQDAVGGPPFQGDVAPAAAGGGLVYLVGGPTHPSLVNYSYSGLPPGCTSQNTMSLTCTPGATASGFYTIEVRGVDSAGHVGFANTSVTVATPGSFEIDQFSTIPGAGSPVGRSVTFSTGVANASGAVSYTYSGLPGGCQSTNSASFTCTPTAAGAFDIEVNATDALGHTASAILTLGILPQSGGIWVDGFFDQEPTVLVNQAATLQVTMASSSVTGSVRAVDAGNGTTRWLHSSPGFLYAGPTYANGLVIDAAMASNFTWTTIEVLNATTGRLLSTYNVTGMVDGEPVVADGRIYFGTATSTFRGNGEFYALDLPLRAQATATLYAPGPNPSFGYGNNFDGWGVGGSPPYSCHWTFGNGAGSYACGPVPYTYFTPGTYRVNLTVTDSVGATSTYSFNFTYYFVGGVCKPGHPCPLWLGAGSTVSTPCHAGSPTICPEARTFSFATYVQNGTSPYTYLWNFGDGTESNLEYPVHTFSADGEYLVMLTVTDHNQRQTSVEFEVSAA